MAPLGPSREFSSLESEDGLMAGKELWPFSPTSWVTRKSSERNNLAAFPSNQRRV